MLRDKASRKKKLVTGTNGWEKFKMNDVVQKCLMKDFEKLKMSIGYDPETGKPMRKKLLRQDTRRGRR